MYMKDIVMGEIQKEKIPLIKIANAHNHIRRSNAVKFRNRPMDSLRGVADKGPLYKPYFFLENQRSCKCKPYQI